MRAWCPAESFSTSQDFNGDIALIACFASSWTPAMVPPWHADPFGFLRPWNECLRSWECATRHAPLDRHRRGHLLMGSLPEPAHVR